VKAAALRGGRSREHEVSLASSAAVREGLSGAGHEALDVRIGRDGAWAAGGKPVTLTPGGGLLDCDAVFPVLHGAYGEDGVVQGLLEALDVPYVGAGVMSSAVCMDKVVFKELMAAAGLPQVAYAAVREGDDPAALEALGLPMFVKPSRMGSSVGISKVTDPSGLPAALAAAFEHDPLVVVEAMSHGMEVECSVLGNLEPEASVPGEIVLNADWYDYEAKYQAGGMELVAPARLPEPVREGVRALAVDAFRRSDCAGLARCDFFVEDPEGDARILVNELNTMPGFTATSVYAKLWQATGLGYGPLLDRLLELAVERHGRERGYRF